MWSVLNKECEVGAKCNSTVSREESDSKADSRLGERLFACGVC